MQTNKSINSLYTLKFFCALFVVFIHVLFAGRVLFIPIMRIAVPCFYIISGYFLIDDNGFLKTEKARIQLLKLLKISVITNVLHLLIESFIQKNSNFSFGNVLRLIFYGDSISIHLWFITAYIEVLLLILFSKKRINSLISFKSFPVIIFCLLASLLLGRYSFVLGRSFDPLWYRNCFTIAIPFMFCGALIHKKQKLLVKAGITKMAMLFFVLCLVLSYGEYFIQSLFPSVFIGGDLNITNIPLSIILFYLCIIYKDLQIPLLTTIGKKHSTFIYLFHYLVINLFWHYNTSYMKEEKLITPFLVWGICILLSMMFNWTYSLIKKTCSQFKS